MKFFSVFIALEHLYQIQRREMEESFTSIESASPSRIKDMTASLKRIKLPRSQFSKISQLFQRNKTSSSNLIDTSPELGDSVTTPVVSPQSNDDGKMKFPICCFTESFFIRSFFPFSHNI